jgi:pimeloyl-ACP methyl ester carboxylesterase
MGGMIVQTMAAMAPDRIDHLVCYGTGPIGVMPDRFETIAQSRLRILEDGIAATVKRIAATWFLDGRNAPGFEKCLELGEKASMQAALASLDAWETWDGRSQLGDIQSPTLVIWGDHDRSYGWNQPEALWRGIENCSLAVVPGCAHNVHMEKSKIFNAILGDFLPTKT